MSNKRINKAYVRYDGTGRVIPGSLILNRFKPQVGNWSEIPAYECCNEQCLTLQVTTLSTNQNIYFYLAVYENTNSDVTFNWGDGSPAEKFNINNITDFDEITHRYSTAGNYTAKVCFSNPANMYIAPIIGSEGAHITSISDITIFKNLFVLSLDNNVGITIVGSSPLHELFLTYCGLTSLNGFDFSLYPNLEHLELLHNSFTSLTLPSTLSNLQYLYLDSNYSLASVDLSALTSLLELHISFCNLTSLNITPLNNLEYLDANSNNLSSTTVDNILAELDADGVVNGFVSLLNNSVPGAAGLISKGNLIGKGWTVETD